MSSALATSSGWVSRAWLYLCNAAYFVRSDDLGWPLDRSEAWLNAVLPRELLAGESAR